MLTYRLHLIRHAITQGNLDGKYIGKSDVPICETGKEKTLEYTQKCIYPNVQKVYVSPLLRCKQTAELLYPDTYTEVVDGLQELDLGDFDGKTFDELKDNESFKLWVKDALHNPPQNGENSIDFANRVKDAIDYIFKDMMKEKISNVAVITHGCAIMTLLATYGLPRLPLGEWFTANSTGYTILMTPQMWTRDNMFEVYAKIPQNIEQLDTQWILERYGATGGIVED